jgi:hypothetical protein
MAQKVQSAAIAWRGYKKLWIQRFVNLALLVLCIVVAFNQGDQSVEHALGRLLLALGFLAWIAEIWANVKLFR